MNLSTTSRALVAALALTGAVLGFAATAVAAPAAPAGSAAVAVAVAVAHEHEGPEPVELNEQGQPDLQED
ncbi:hypothetical protein ACIGO8_05500 [Streptomyces sp. NPDC053493]|uniref:hypothetical protein n=1 Tax=Streptomyces sp. NPDC053493 TaxID=3365705 RepID=UPI0037D23E8C